MHRTAGKSRNPANGPAPIASPPAGRRRPARVGRKLTAANQDPGNETNAQRLQGIRAQGQHGRSRHRHRLSGEPQSTLAKAREAGAVPAYGNFITLLINFLIVAWVLFLLVKAMNRLKRQPEPAPATASAPTREEILLGEIRGLPARR